MKEQLKAASGFLMGVAGFVVIGLVIVGFLRGALWAVENLLPLMVGLSWTALAIDILVLPLAAFRKSRAAAGTIWLVSSFVFGLVGWFYGFAFTYALWGGWAVVLGLFFFGVGVIPLGLVATMINGLWQPFWLLIVLLIVALVTRIVGVAMGASAKAD